MAKAKAPAKKVLKKTSKTKVRQAPITVAPVLNGTRPANLRGTDFNPRSLESVGGASRGEVGYESVTEPKLEAHMQTVEENAAYVEEHWKARIKKEGTPYFTCPFCTGTTQEKFMGKDAKKKAEAHIKKNHPQQLKAAKLTGVPKAAYGPQAKIQSPKRTLADAVHPKFRPMVEAQMRQRELLAPLAEQARNLTVHGSPLLKLVAMTESLAIQKLRGLNDKDLVGIVQLARNRGRRQLARAAAALCATKGLNSEVRTTDPSAKYMLIQEALRKANVPATIQRRG